jgi:uncharacterized protein (TIGR03086 family)
MARSTSSAPLHDHRALDWLALCATSRIVAQIRDHQWELPTPCAGWCVRDLLRHMVGNNNGFALAARGVAADRAVWAGGDLPDVCAEAWEESVQLVVAAFAELTDLSHTVPVLGYGEIPAGQAVGMHFVDYLTHGWDVAVSIGVEPDLEEELCREVLRMAARWPAGHPAIWGPGAAFGYPVDVPGTGCAAEQMLGLLGRSPSWSGTTTPPRSAWEVRTTDEGGPGMAADNGITAVLDRWAAGEAAGDNEVLADCLSEDFVGVGPLGFLLPKQAWLHRHGSGGLVYEKFELQETQVREYGDTAVVTTLVDQPGTYQGNPIPQCTRSTLVLVKQDGQWRISTDHMSFVAGTPGAPPIPTAS